MPGTVVLYFQYAKQPQKMASVIKAQSMDLSKAILNKDKESIAKLLHPKMIELADSKAESVQKTLIGQPLQIVQFKKE
jgi:hypothetical protein